MNHELKVIDVGDRQVFWCWRCGLLKTDTEVRVVGEEGVLEPDANPPCEPPVALQR